jgi:hypothetical protein
MGSTATLANVSTATQSFGAVTSAAGAYNKSQADKSAYGLQAQTAADNAQMAEWQAQDATRRGEKAEQVVRGKTAQLKSTQRASMAARGLDVNQGSAADIQADTDYMGEIDALTTRDNAARAAWGYRVQESNYKTQSGMLKIRQESENPWMAAAPTLISGATGVAKSWYKNKQAGIDSGGND